MTMTALGEALRELPEATFVDLYESAAAYLVVLDLPGVEAEDVVVDGGRANVEITAERSPSVPEGFEPVRQEREDRVDVTLPLPPDAVGTDVTTEFDRGVLELTVPRTDKSDRADAEATG